MRLLFQVLILTIMVIVSACGILPQQGMQRTSSGRAAYGTTVPDFKTHKKKNQKIKKKATKAAKRKDARNSRSPWDRRPY